MSMSKRSRLSRDQKRKKKLALRRRDEANKVLPYHGRKYQDPKFAFALMLAEKAILECDFIAEHHLTDNDVERSLEYLVLKLRSQQPAQHPQAMVVKLPDGTTEDGISQKIVEFWAMHDVIFPAQDLSGILRTLWNSVRTRHSMRVGERGYLDFLEVFLGNMGQSYQEITPQEAAQFGFISEEDEEEEESDDQIEHWDKSGQDPADQPWKSKQGLRQITSFGKSQ